MPGRLLIRWLTRHLAHLVRDAAARVCVEGASLRGGGGGALLPLRGYLATEGSVCRAHILTTLSVVFLNVG